MSAEHIILNKDRLAQVIEIALNTQKNKEFVFSGDYVSPEKPFIQLLTDYGKEIKDPTFAINAIFLTTSLIRGNMTKSFFEGISDKEKLGQNAWIFIPKDVISKGKTITEKTCLDFFKPAGYSRSAIFNWYHNSQILLKYDGDIRKMFHHYGNDANLIAKAVYIRNRAKTHEKTETFLGYGPKLTFLALQWISLYNFYNFKNMDNLPVDFQIARIAIQTDSLILSREANADLVITRTLMPAIKQVCKEKGIDPRIVSQALWTLGSEGCNNKLHQNCPLNNICVRYITSRSYQRNGKFTSIDEGRYK